MAATLHDRDETVAEMNSRLPSIVDNNLGSGFLEGRAKQRLVKLPSKRKMRFCPDSDVQDTFKAFEATTSSSAAVRAKLAVDVVGPDGVSYGVRKEAACSKESSHGNARVEYTFTRVIAKRSILLPRFKKLQPVRRKEHVDDEDRWLVELFGNRVCTTERYGGRAVISFTWQQGHTVSAQSLKAKIKAFVVNGTVDGELSSKWDQYQIHWSINFGGFRPDGVDYNKTSVAGARDMITALKTLPITSAVPVEALTVPVENASGFPYHIKVETHIRDKKMLDRIADVMQQLEQTGHHASSAFMFAEYIGEKIEDASYNNRVLLPQLRDIVDEMTQALRDHGKCVHLYKSGDERRLYKDNCSKTPVTSAGTQVVAGLTAGLSIPFTLLGQKPRWDQAAVWTTPENYTAVEFTRTHNAADYYYRAKSELLFDNDQLVSRWRNQVDDLSEETSSKRPSRSRGVWASIVDFFHCW